MISTVQIIAEVGVNHNGDLRIAKELARAASDAGADIVKYQSFDPDQLTLPNAETAQYQHLNTNEKYQIKLLKQLQLSDDNQRELSCYCEKIGIEFLSTGFDRSSLENLTKLGIKRVKVPSGEITNTPFLEYIASLDLPIILSTGMSTLGEIEQALKTLNDSGAKNRSITVLHCTSNYPAHDDELNLRALSVISSSFNVAIGYSDHSVGKEAAIAAVAMGATIIEKHITVDRSMPGPDHRASMEIDEFHDFVRSLRRVEIALGKAKKEPSPSEKATQAFVRKSIVTSQSIKAGDIFSPDNLTTKRPGTGLSASKWNDVIGKTSKRNYAENELIDVCEL